MPTSQILVNLFSEAFHSFAVVMSSHKAMVHSLLCFRMGERVIIEFYKPYWLIARRKVSRMILTKSLWWMRNINSCQLICWPCQALLVCRRSSKSIQNNAQFRELIIGLKIINLTTLVIPKSVAMLDFKEKTTDRWRDFSVLLVNFLSFSL